MSQLRTIAQRIRHLPGLEKAEGLWKIVRRPYQKVLNFGGRGVSVRVGGKAEVRIPAEFAAGSWEAHEPEAVDMFVQCVHDHPGGLVLDIGSSVGIFSAIALFVDPTTEVIAFDSDLSSLAAVRRMCQYASESRLRLVNCFVADVGSASETIGGASALTELALKQSGVRGDVGTTRYIGFSDKSAASIPTYTLDGLLVDEMSSKRPLLVKCDVEGAELKVLHGASRSIQQLHPSIILSVHPSALLGYGSAKEEVATFLQSVGYKTEVIAIDHEEHWWCEFSNQNRG